MATFKLDDREIPFEDGDTIIRAAWRQGIEIPHYCWHPGLSVAANCRMCLVEIKSGRPMMMPVLKWSAEKSAFVSDTKPKLQPACQVPAADGLEVSTKSEPVVSTQAAVQELLLLNHPVDCPICDQAGECKLQDYWLDHQHSGKRKLTEPVHKPKAQRFGPTIVYDAERCIMCTRCIRFCDEIVGDHVLDMRERGNRNEITVAPGRELDHKYTLMTEHVCPVGALTSRDFRFKARVWFLKTSATVCPGCATGCSAHADYDPRTQQIRRLRPRDNAGINQYWMCDDGMLSYHRVHQGRLLTALCGRGEDRAPLATSEGISIVAERLGALDGTRVAVLLSAQHGTEDNFALARFAKECLGTSHLYLAARKDWDGDAILRASDQNPNRAGALRAAGGSLASFEALNAAVAAGQIDGVVALASQFDGDAESFRPLAGLSAVIALTDSEGPLAAVADLVLPVTSWAESHGTFVNAKGKAQVFRPAVRAPAGLSAGWELIADLAGRLGRDLGFRTVADVRAAMPATKSEAIPMEEARA